MIKKMLDTNKSYPKAYKSTCFNTHTLGETHLSKYVQFNETLLLVKDAAICIILII